jgi:site-specific DNA-cytosine methylase
MIADESCMEPKLTFIDLFAGIGGFHIAFKNAGAHCVFTSEWDKHARNTYFHNFKEKDPHLFGSNPEEETPYFVGDITKITTTSKIAEVLKTRLTKDLKNLDQLKEPFLASRFLFSFPF